MLTMSCGDVVPGCRQRLSAPDEPELLARLADHWRAAHPELQPSGRLIDAARRRFRETEAG